MLQAPIDDRGKHTRTMWYLNPPFPPLLPLLPSKQSCTVPEESFLQEQHEAHAKLKQNEPSLTQTVPSVPSVPSIGVHSIAAARKDPNTVGLIATAGHGLIVKAYQAFLVQNRIHAL